MCYVDANYNVHEDFVTFIKLERVCAIDISEAITGCEEELGISLNNLRVEGRDGALIMSGEKSGVQKRIRDKQPQAIYPLCWAFFQFSHYLGTSAQEDPG